MPFLLERKERRCGKCNCMTVYVYVRNIDIVIGDVRSVLRILLTQGKSFFLDMLRTVPFGKDLMIWNIEIKWTNSKSELGKSNRNYFLKNVIRFSKGL